jgi:hypothetical protein
MVKNFWDHGINPITGYKIENKNTLSARKSAAELKRKNRWQQILTSLREK